ncbi:DNA-processing protein DprA [Glaciibacter sp. 2TAF33]|uniref:DNA-processing protein DprA n=1 Tax=Glaciibacter sp. 2TAF33 TaxID=3233015 RepID=UPI003F92361C
MTIFGLDEGTVRDLASAVRPAWNEALSAAAPRSSLADSARDDAECRTDEHPDDRADGLADERVDGRADRTADDRADLTADDRADVAANNPADIFARAAWSTIAEPGDGMAGLVVGCLGAAGALRSVIDRWAPDRLALAVRERAGGDVDDGDADEFRRSVEQALQRWAPRLKSRDVILCLRQAGRVGARLLLPGDRLWPEGVNDLGAHAPLGLWWRGVPEAFEALPQSVSLVGARAATGYGEHVAMEASAGLVDRGYAIVSGAAYGIDGMAHRAALASQGITVAFLAGGVDRFYPSGHDALLGRIAESGAVISELPCGAAPTKWRFLQRNRLIAAASRATVVLEAGWRSGSLNTAGHAAALGRPLGAVPGPVTSPTSAGCHRLIREYDAVCVTNALEMAELLGEDPGGRGGSGTPGGHGGRGDADPAGGRVRGVPGERAAGRTSDQIRVLDALSSRSPRSIADVGRRAGLATNAVLGALGALELEGAARERETGWLRG